MNCDHHWKKVETSDMRHCVKCGDINGSVQNPTPPKEDNYLDVSCPSCGAVPKHGHLCQFEIKQALSEQLKDL